MSTDYNASSRTAYGCALKLISGSLEVDGRKVAPPQWSLFDFFKRVKAGPIAESETPGVLTRTFEFYHEGFMVIAITLAGRRERTHSTKRITREGAAAKYSDSKILWKAAKVRYMRSLACRMNFYWFPDKELTELVLN